MESKVIIDGIVYSIYEMMPTYEIPRDIKQEVKTRKEKKDHYKKMARFNYKKK